ncbi:digestive cysteine proteinase 3-like [Planococcus citri]|uniref:digestive cysteine proteinase 3-like n=1 Tax=Planococcus citri TaxID=170843 RepID=UPI0031F7DDB2
MKTLFLLFVCATVIINFGTCTDTDDITTWEDFKEKYKRNYTGADDETRKNIFNINVENIKKHNEKFDKREVTFKMGMNEFGDLTHSEFLNLFSVREIIQKDANVDTENDVLVFDDSGPLQCDWRELKAVKTVHNQQACKSGWAYSAADALAARYNISYNNSCDPLCARYFIKCSGGMGNNGCKGGLAFKACELVNTTRVMPDENSFKNKDCKLDKMKNKVTLNIKDCVNRKHGYANISNELCTNGPVSASISAEKPSFQFAKEGIYYEDDCEKTPNHQVLLVGYQIENSENPYWIVKNSFGDSWGENGFLKISTKVSKSGCRIIGDVSFPVF